VHAGVGAGPVGRRHVTAVPAPRRSPELAVDGHPARLPRRDDDRASGPAHGATVPVCRARSGDSIGARADRDVKLAASIHGAVDRRRTDEPHRARTRGPETVRRPAYEHQPAAHVAGDRGRAPARMTRRCGARSRIPISRSAPGRGERQQRDRRGRPCAHASLTLRTRPGFQATRRWGLRMRLCTGGRLSTVERRQRRRGPRSRSATGRMSAGIAVGACRCPGRATTYVRLWKLTVPSGWWVVS
jgi:hypothetical protein